MTTQDLNRPPKRRHTFFHRGIELPYLYHSYNYASHNMRSVEVPIVCYYLALMRAQNPNARVLEFGNVLEHYMVRDWPVLDIKEKRQGIINADVMAWEPPQRYDLIMSISTIEHVGFGAYAEYTASVLPCQVVSRLKSWLTPDGVLIATVPAGYNKQLDHEIIMGKLGIDYNWFMRRINDANEWGDCTLQEWAVMPFNGKWKWGSGMVILQVGELEWR